MHVRASEQRGAACVQGTRGVLGRPQLLLSHTRCGTDVQVEVECDCYQFVAPPRCATVLVLHCLCFIAAGSATYSIR